MANQASQLLLTRRAVVLVGIESTYNTDPGLSPSTDAVLVSTPDYKTTNTVLERNFVRQSLSPLGHIIGRKLAMMDFGMEFRSNGLTQSGSLGNECILGRMLRACGYAATSLTGGAAVGAPVAVVNAGAVPTWVGAGTSLLSNVSVYTATVVLGGASATAKIRITGGQFLPTGESATTGYLPQEGVTASVSGAGATTTLAVVTTNPLAPTITVGGSFHAGDVLSATICGITFTYTAVSGDTNLSGVATSFAAVIAADARMTTTAASSAVITVGYTSVGAGIVVTSGSTVLNVGTTGVVGLTIKPTWTGNLTLGDSWTIPVYPQGIQYSPISTNQQSASLKMYFDGMVHEMNGAYGTFSIDAEAGKYATIKFSFTGQYVAPVNAALPTTTQETTLPAVVQLAQLILGNNQFQPTVEKFTFDQGNVIVPRPDVSSADGYNGVRLTERKPKGSITPEATLVSDYDWWGKLAASTQTALTLKIGSTAGNIICINAPTVQLGGLTYADRAGIRSYNAPIEFTTNTGDNEISFITA